MRDFGLRVLLVQVQAQPPRHRPGRAARQGPPAAPRGHRARRPGRPRHYRQAGRGGPGAGLQFQVSPRSRGSTHDIGWLTPCRISELAVSGTQES